MRMHPTSCQILYWITCQSRDLEGPCKYQVKVSFSCYSFTKQRKFGQIKTLEDEKYNVAEMMISPFDTLENILGKGENSS